MEKINITALKEALQSAVEKYNSQTKSFWQGEKGKYRAINVSRLLVDNSNGENENAIIYLFLSICNSSSTQLIKLIANEIITGHAAREHNLQEIKTSNTLQSNILPKSLLRSMTKKIENYRVVHSHQHPPSATLRFSKSLGLKFIAKEIITEHHLKISGALHDSFKKTNHILEQEPKQWQQIDLDAIERLYGELPTKNTSSHIELQKI